MTADAGPLVYYKLTSEPCELISKRHYFSLNIPLGSLLENISGELKYDFYYIQ